ncbi:MAG: ABC-F family ATP-binding cassette domain-containing protein [Actinobacteria bacterium]|nr:ABC-F family ATP-binding cassette domain-containing protein [Actinomycetota bacterium]
MPRPPRPQASRPASLAARAVTVEIGDRTILDAIDLAVTPGDRIGVVAPNGTGKSTLLRVLAGEVLPTAGEVTSAPPDANVGLLAQEHQHRPGERVRDLLARRTGVEQAAGELDAATSALAGEEAGADERYAAALDRWMALGGADLDARLGPVWADLGLAPELLDLDTAALSGGQRARTALAGLLLSRFDVLLLDEPTNDLDFDGLDRLEAFLDSVSAGVVLVSHDRAFLARSVTAVLELDEHTHRGRRFDGGWAAYLDERAVARRHAEEAYDGFASRRADLEQRIRTQRQWAVQGVAKAKRTPRDNDKAQRDFKLNRTEKQAAKVRQSEKALVRLDAVDKPWEGWELRFEIAAAPRSGAVSFRLDAVVVERGDFRLGPVHLDVRWGERVALVGANGSGKTTLLDTVLGRLPLAGGERWIGPGVVVGEVDQGRALLAGATGGGSATLLSAFCAAAGQDVTSEARSLLAKFGLGAGHVARPVRTLSPGERTRAVLAVLQARGVNCLVLDEPTNHLDLPAIEQLEAALDRFPGTLLLVSHDRSLLAAVRVDRTLVIERGQLRSRD